MPMVKHIAEQCKRRPSNNICRKKLKHNKEFLNIDKEIVKIVKELWNVDKLEYC